MEILDSFGKTSLDTDLRRDKTQGALEIIRLIDNLTKRTAESPEGTEMKDVMNMSETALFDSMLRLGLPTDRDIDLRKRFVEEEPERTNCLEVDQCAQTPSQTVRSVGLPPEYLTRRGLVD